MTQGPKKGQSSVLFGPKPQANIALREYISQIKNQGKLQKKMKIVTMESVQTAKPQFIGGL